VFAGERDDLRRAAERASRVDPAGYKVDLIIGDMDAVSDFYDYADDIQYGDQYGHPRQYQHVHADQYPDEYVYSIDYPHVYRDSNHYHGSNNDIAERL